MRLSSQKKRTPAVRATTPSKRIRAVRLMALIFLG
jgi:hypothetical protein